MDFKAELDKRVEEIEGIIRYFLPEEKGYQKTVLEAVNYSVLGGGKRLRPMLMSETYKLFNGQDGAINYFMAAIELVHTYSLVHDDLECMDNDEFRRGRKTTHAVYGEGMAVLAGDALLNCAVEIAASAFDETSNPNAVVKSMRILFNKSGIYGMLGGQVADVVCESKDSEVMDKDMIMFIHENKTAALLQASLMIGGLLGGATEVAVRTLERIGYNIGIAFQIQDDILDVTSTFEELGKPIGSDERNNKMTFVSLYGLEEAKKEVERLSIDAINLLHTLPGDNEFLEELLRSLINRRK
ncbi:MAG: polyprenyl synthetase family protein [Lachnospiraceae bacterium]|nr:polyprenyl synthetase family protein [Lachnospiraceae bacterium]